ncbi:hypothetical protein BJX76DRAFT_323930 [Aspergillus varians]
MSQTQTSSQPPIEVIPLDLNRDLSSITQIWTATLPQYPISADNLRNLLPKPDAHHLIARIDTKTVGFCLSYAAGYLAVLAVHPTNQHEGVGSALLTETKAWFKANRIRLEIGSGFPRFWPGVPTDLPPGTLDFFTRRGFRMRSCPPRSVDLYRDIRAFSLEEGEYGQQAERAGYTFAPLLPEGYEECLVGQERNFADNGDWVAMYRKLNPAEHPSSVMTAFDSSGVQVGWTLMLSPSSNILQSNWAMPTVCGPNTGLVGCVGIDTEHRKSGVGIALVAHALEDMKKRGIEGVFVDWVSLEGFYERVGFEVWRSYRTGEIS